MCSLGRQSFGNGVIAAAVTRAASFQRVRIRQHLSSGEIVPPDEWQRQYRPALHRAHHVLWRGVQQFGDSSGCAGSAGPDQQPHRPSTWILASLRRNGFAGEEINML